MTWMGWDEWQAPDGYIDVAEVWPAWELEGHLVLFFIANTSEDPVRTLYSQRCAVDESGHLTPESEVHTIQVLDERSNWHISDVQRAGDTHFAVWTRYIEVSSG